MSNSSAPELGTLDVRGQVGTEIRVFDKDFVLQARGTVRLTKEDLAPGLYMINWTTGQQVQQQVVRVRPSVDPRIVEQPPLEQVGLPAIEKASRVVESPAPRARTARGEVAILIDRNKAEDFDLSSVRLFRSDSSERLRSDGRSVRGARDDEVEQTVLRRYEAAAGSYRLQYKSSTGETLNQIVPILAGRRTVVILEPEDGYVLVNENGRLTTQRHSGVRAGSTTIVTVGLGAKAEDLRERIRLGQILLNNLTTGRTGLGEDLLAQVRAGSDPLVKLYAASIIVDRLDRNLSPVLERPYPSASEGSTKTRWFRASWLRVARALCTTRRKGTPDDFRLVHSYCMRLLGQAEAMRPLDAPPLLERSWRIAVRMSVFHPKLIPTSYSFRGVLLGSIGIEPWLIWRPAAAKTAPDTWTLTTGDIASLAASATSKLIDLALNSAGLSTAFGRTWEDARKVLNKRTFAPDRSILLRDIDVPSENEASGGIEQSMQAIGAPDTPVRRTDIESSLARDLSSIPPLTLPIVDPDDPQSGRFGGAREASGFRLTASFAAAQGSDWVKVHLAVVSNEMADDEVAIFCLHDTFDPDIIAIPFSGNVARFEITAWGGFTVGVWLRSSQVALELDLKKVPKAPRIIREL